MLRIPFGWSLADQRYVFAEQVVSGRACQCICPSCKAPLQARLGEIRQPHFAHLTYGHEDEANHRCEYSFYVVAAAMARQMLFECDRVALPGYTKQLTSLDMQGHEHWRQVEICQNRVLTHFQAFLGERYNDTPVDVIFETNTGPLLVQITHPERLPEQPSDMASLPIAGMLALDITHTWSMYLDSGNGIGFQGAFQRLILDSTTGKNWLFHAEEEALIEKTRSDLHEQARLADAERVNLIKTSIAVTNQHVHQPPIEPAQPQKTYRLSRPIVWAEVNPERLKVAVSNYTTMMRMYNWNRVYERAMELQHIGNNPDSAIATIRDEIRLSATNRMVLGFLWDAGIVCREKAGRP